MPANPYEWLATRNTKMVEMLDKNMDISGFIAALLDHLVTYSERKGIPFEDIILEAPFIGDDEYLRARIKSRRDYS